MNGAANVQQFVRCAATPSSKEETAHTSIAVQRGSRAQRRAGMRIGMVAPRQLARHRLPPHRHCDDVAEIEHRLRGPIHRPPGEATIASCALCRGLILPAHAIRCPVQRVDVAILAAKVIAPLQGGLRAHRTAPSNPNAHFNLSLSRRPASSPPLPSLYSECWWGESPGGHRRGFDQSN